MRQGEIGPILEIAFEAGQSASQAVLGFIGQEDRKETFAPLGNIVPAEAAGALAGAALANGEETAKAAIGGNIRRVDENRDIVIEIQAAANDETHSGLLGSLMRPHNSCNRIAVDDSQGHEAEFTRSQE
jgi:hypothetical protein